MLLNDNGSINGLWESNLEEFNKTKVLSAKKILATGQNSSICCCVTGVREMCIMNPNSGFDQISEKSPLQKKNQFIIPLFFKLEIIPPITGEKNKPPNKLKNQVLRNNNNLVISKNW